MCLIHTARAESKLIIYLITDSQNSMKCIFPEFLSSTSDEKIVQGLLEDGKSAQTGVTTASATAGTLNTEKRNDCGPQCANPMVHSTGATTQRQNGFRTAESKWDTQKMSTKEVTVNVTKNIRQSDRRKTKNCVN
uniref:BAALC binder of MAP3K1 and KLF4 n=1 Tax=Bubo bubo TaxID=30461 RepID=A0A8C0EXW3_BUBBB